MTYPTTRTSGIIDRLHGIDVPDPYRWLEDAESEETRTWVRAQNALTRSFLDQGDRLKIAARLTELFNYPRTTAPVRRGDRYFFSHNSGLQPQAVLYVQEGAAGVPRVLIDPNTLSLDGTVALTAVEPSVNGALIAYALSRSGSDEQEIRIRDVQTGSDLTDCLHWVKFASIAWSIEQDGFYYLRFPEPGAVAPGDDQYFGRLYFHHLGDAQLEDRLIFETPGQKEVVPLVQTTHDGRFVVITAQREASDDSEVYLIDLAMSADSTSVASAFNRKTIQPLFVGFDAAYAFIGSADGRLFFRTTRGAPRGRIVAVDVNNTGDTLEEVVPETPDRLASAVLARGTIVAAYLRNASDRIRLFDPRGRRAGEIELPGIGSLASLDAQPDASDVLLTFTSFTHPPAAYRCTLPDRAIARFGFAEDPNALAVDAYETEQVWYSSKDGTRVSMFLVHRKNLSRDADRPTLLNGYGGFNISRTPVFDPGIFPILDRGGVFALPNLRGGGEYGEDWHRAGMLDRKQNVFDDFIAAAEYLVAERYTNPRRLAIEGGSNGGLLVGAVMVQRPDLFGAVICRVPVVDMLRYHLFTVGRSWIPEYGSADDPDQFRFLLAYSPYHNVHSDGIYPPVLVMTADTDDRVSPGMAKKFAARLQAVGREGPFLIRIETKAGHGAGKPVAKQIDEDADILAFLEKTSWPSSESDHSPATG